MFLTYYIIFSSHKVIYEDKNMSEILSMNPLVKLDESLAGISDKDYDEKSILIARRSLRRIEGVLRNAMYLGGNLHYDAIEALGPINESSLTPPDSQIRDRLYYFLGHSSLEQQNYFYVDHPGETTGKTGPYVGGGRHAHYYAGGNFLRMMEALGVNDTLDTGLWERLLWKDGKWPGEKIASVNGSTIAEEIAWFRQFIGDPSRANRMRANEVVRFKSVFGISFDVEIARKIADNPILFAMPEYGGYR